MKTSHQPSAEKRRRFLLTAKKVCEAIKQDSNDWTRQERHIAAELIKQLVGDTPSRLLVRRIRHVLDGETSIVMDGGAVIKVSYVELDEYVGLRSYQQRIVEKCYQEVCDQLSVSADS